MTRPTTLVLALTLTLTPSCSAPPDAAITRDLFIDVVVAVRAAENAVAESDSADARFEERRDAILAAYGVTQEDLYAFLERHRDLSYMEAVWDSITQRLKSPIGGVGADDILQVDTTVELGPRGALTDGPVKPR